MLPLGKFIRLSRDTVPSKNKLYSILEIRGNARADFLLLTGRWTPKLHDLNLRIVKCQKMYRFTTCKSVDSFEAVAHEYEIAGLHLTSHINPMKYGCSSNRAFEIF